MKILMLTPYLPYPPASGGQIRTLNLLKYLSNKNQITLVALYKNDHEKKYLTYLTPYCQKIYLCKREEKPWKLKTILKSLFLAKPFLIVRNFSSEAEEILKKILSQENFDVIHAETFYIMPHLPKTSIPIFLVEQTIEFKVYQHFVNSLPFFIRPLFYLDIFKLKQWERNYWKKAFLVGAVSDIDKELINQLEPQIKPVIVPNGAGEEMIVKKVVKKNLHLPVILFQGNFFWLQNTEAAYFLIKNIYPVLKKILPAVKLIIAGQNASNKIKTNTDFLEKNKNIKIINIKPDNSQLTQKLYRQASVFIAPIFGPGGTRLKILAAMASGVPVISTETGVQGLEVKNQIHVLIAETTEEFINKIKTLLSNERLYYKIQKNAYLLVKEKYNWETIAQQLEVIYKGIVSGK